MIPLHNNERPHDYRDEADFASGMRRFELCRMDDASGVSGTGTVAEGIEFSNGQIALSWLTPMRSVGIYPNLKEVLNIHGHGGKTIVKWVGDATNQEQAQQRSDAYESGFDQGRDQGVRDSDAYVASLERTVDAVVDLIREEGGHATGPDGIVAYIRHIHSGLKAADQYTTDLKAQKDRLLQRNGELLGFIARARHALHDLVRSCDLTEEVQLKALLAARKNGAALLEELPR
jgi:hypothetical protein